MAAPKDNKYAVGNKGPAPTRYTQEFIEKEAYALVKWMGVSDNVFKRFALERGYSSDELSNFAKKSEVFALAYKRAKEWQECKLVEGGLFNKFNANFVKFAMSNLCGWSDRQQVSGDTANPLAFIMKHIDGTSKELVNGNT